MNKILKRLSITSEPEEHVEKIIENESNLLVKQFQDLNITIYGTYEEPLFKAKDIGDLLGIVKIRDSLKNLDEEDKILKGAGFNGGLQEQYFITENGLYELIFLSKKPIAKQFKKWIKSVIKGTNPRRFACSFHSLFIFKLFEFKNKNNIVFIEMNKILKRLSITSEPEETSISTLNQITIDTKDPIIKKIQEKFTNENQQEIFKLSFNLFIQYKDSNKDEFVIDLDEVYNFIGFTRKDNAKRTLQKCLKLNEDYKIVFLQVEENLNGGRPKEQILIKLKAFKKFCLKAQTEVSEQIYEYYLTTDPRFYFVKCSLRSLSLLIVYLINKEFV